MTEGSELAPFAPNRSASRTPKSSDIAEAEGVLSIALLPLNLFRLRTFRFAVVGMAATLTHGGSLGLLAGVMSAPPVLANSAAVVAASCVSYFGHRGITFRSQTPHATAFAKFIVQVAATWALTSAIAAYLIPVLGAWPVSVFIMILMPCVNYFVYARWTFR